jgi:hypothetical protein
MPLLDIQIKVNSSSNEIDWKFYKKEVSSPYTIFNTSGMPGKVKRVSMVQEGLRRLRNTRPSLVPGLRTELMEDLAETMLISGYPEEFRAGVVRDAVVGYKRLAAVCARREAPVQAAGLAAGGEALGQATNTDTVLFVPATPDSKLAVQARKVLEEEAGRLDVSVRVEVGHNQLSGLVLGHSVEMFLIVNIHVPKYDFFVEL